MLISCIFDLKLQFSKLAPDSIDETPTQLPPFFVHFFVIIGWGRRKSSAINIHQQSFLLVLEPRETVRLILPFLLLAEGLHRTTGELFVEIGDISVRGKNRHEGRLDRPVQKSVPVDLLKPRMGSNLVRRNRAEPVPRVLLEQPHEEVLQLGGGLDKQESTLGTLRGS